MSRFLRMVVLLVGIMLAVAGGGCAAYVGPSDTVRLPGHLVDGGSPVLVLGWRLLAYEGTTLQVGAAAGDGPVFVGAANPVDVDSYLSTARVLDVRHVGPTGTLTGDLVGPEGGTVPVPPDQAGFWTVSTSGSGEQRLDVALTGDPVSVVVVSPAGSTVTVSLGAFVPGLFRLAVVGAGVGVVLLALAALAARRPRRRGRTAARGGAAPPTPSPVPSPSSAGSARSSAHVDRRAVSATRLGVPVLTCLALSGCLALPQGLSTTRAPSKVALTPDQVSAVVTDYAARNDAVIDAVAADAPETSWAQVDSGVVLAGDTVSTVLNRGLGKPGADASTPRWAPQPGTAYAGRFAAYPQWAVVPVTWTRDGDEPSRVLSVFQRAAATTPWRLWTSVPQGIDLPAPLPQGSDATADPADLTTGAELRTRVAAYLADGTDPRIAGESLASLRQALTTFDGFTGKVVCKPAIVDERPEDAVRVVKTSAGRLVVVALRCDVTLFAKQGQNIRWQDAYAKAYGQSTAELSSISSSRAVSVALLQADDGTTQLAGLNYWRVRSTDVGWPS